MQVLNIKNVKKSFDGNEILHGIDLSLEKGSVLSIIGPSGSGKSTLLRCICGLETVDSGTIEICGEKLCSDDTGKVVYPDKNEFRRIRGKLCMVFQNFNLFPHLSVMENLTIAPTVVKGVSKEEAEFAAGFSLGNIGKAEAIISSEEFQDLKELTLSILRYIHEIESYEIADKVKEYKKYKNRIEDFFDIFLMWFRDIMLLKADNSVNAEAAKKKIIFKNEYAYLKKQVDKLDLEAIDYVIGKIHRARVRIKSNVNFDATLELLIVEARREF